MFKLSRLFKKKEEKFMDWDSYSKLVHKVDVLAWQQSVRSRGIPRY